ncbi:lysophospholipase, putative [Plasmodium berghei]|uniref:Lysophospholipase, putative n=2 Tax=Plasmodium berghei TaxID=5821 RepID=A0A509AFI3_PLABA|nr:lysophospholipase, putative [Plasmodium berghei ANKA]CXI21086.1 lysophospholipase, putative [Plasmodium berghei]SBW38155.1 lysophospholipase, putative [Plasmodium berghei]SCL81881.1 lysophospholipase, putative [Plasmodium berghei]SCL82197.1 lysophospholipase, putative [Plasmodium berghei]SCL82458.1 lysophospholipase, putative [Plasmodium berghei]|eukprot:XP_034420733.1 lysophospholipase, putative [Plasmodium berghei ANKA]
MEEAELNNDELRKTVFNLDGNPKVDYFYNKDGLLLKTYGWIVKKALGIVLLIHGLKGHARFTYLRANAEVINNNEVLVIDNNNYYVYNGSWVEKFNQSGYSVYALDLQGHGESEGWANLRGHIKRFGDLVDDVIQYMNKIQDEISNDNINDDESHDIVITQKKRLPMYIVGHSMGGNIALRVLQVLNKAKEKSVSKVEDILKYKKNGVLIGDFMSIYDNDDLKDEVTSVSEPINLNNAPNDNTIGNAYGTYCISNDSACDNDNDSTTTGGSDINNTSVSTEGNVIASTSTEYNVIASTSTEYNVIASTSTEDNVIANTSAEDNVIASTSTEDNVIASTSAEDNVIASTSAEDNVITSTSAEDNVIPNTSAEDNVIASTSTEDNVIPNTSTNGNNKNNEKYNCLDKLNIKGCVSLSGMVSFEKIAQPGTNLFNYIYLPITHFLSYIAPNMQTMSELPYKSFPFIENLCKVDKYRHNGGITFKYVYELIKAMGALNDDINYIPKDIPLLFIHAKDDCICYYKGVKLFYDRINSYNKELYSVENMDHSLTIEPGNELIVQKIIDWICSLEKDNKNAIEDQA